MKKFLIVILSLLYMASATGTTVHLHYCMGKLVAVDLAQPEGKKCAICGMKKDKKATKGCCKDEHKQVKVGQDHKITDSFAHLAQTAALVPGAFPEIPPVLVPSFAGRHPRSHAPPYTGSVRIYLRNRVLLI